MNDTIKKIQVQIDYHMAELNRLQTALDVFAEYEGKPAAKELPMFTVQRIGGGALRGQPGEAKPEKQKKVKVDRVKVPGRSTIAVRKQVLASLEYHNKPMSRQDIIASINLEGRTIHSLDSCLSTLRKDGKINKTSDGYSLAVANKPVGETVNNGSAAAA